MRFSRYLIKGVNAYSQLIKSMIDLPVPNIYPQTLHTRADSF